MEQRLALVLAIAYISKIERPMLERRTLLSMYRSLFQCLRNKKRNRLLFQFAQSKG